jgi:hypothetical protein
MTDRMPAEPEPKELGESDEPVLACGEIADASVKRRGWVAVGSDIHT